MKTYKATFKLKNGIKGEITLYAEEAIRAIVMISEMLTKYDVEELNIKEVI